MIYDTYAKVLWNIEWYLKFSFEQQFAGKHNIFYSGSSGCKINKQNSSLLIKQLSVLKGYHSKPKENKNPPGLLMYANFTELSFSSPALRVSKFYVHLIVSTLKLPPAWAFQGGFFFFFNVVINDTEDLQLILKQAKLLV